jgi:hypothetical protein
MKGIRKHGLIDRMSEESFTFLIGLILEANELGFKNPFTLTVGQALPIGGGKNRQTLHGRRKSLANFKIDGKPLVKVKAGNKGRNSAASYEIDYNLLCSYNGVWQGETDIPSKIFDGSPNGTPDGASDGSPDSPLTIHRSEEIREEQIPPNPPNKVTTGNGENDAGEGGGSSSTNEKVKRIQNAIMRKYGSQLTREPKYGAVNDALHAFDMDDRVILHGIDIAPPSLTSPKPESALNLAIACYNNQRQQATGVTPDKIDETERELAVLEQTLAEAREDPETNPKWIEQTEAKVIQLSVWLQEYGGK